MGRDENKANHEASSGAQNGSSADHDRDQHTDHAVAPASDTEADATETVSREELLSILEDQDSEDDAGEDGDGIPDFDPGDDTSQLTR